MRKQIVSKTKLIGNQECKVLYHEDKDIVELEVGGTTLKLAAVNFFMMNEMMRKAAAKLVMQTQLKHDLVDDVAEETGPLKQNFYLSKAPQLNLQVICA